MFFIPLWQRRQKVKKALGFEIDPVYFNPAKEIWKNTNLEMINQDFLLSEPKEKVSLIISNPPYSRHHHVPVDYKKIRKAERILLVVWSGRIWTSDGCF